MAQRPFEDWLNTDLTFLQRAMAFFEMSSGEFAREWKRLSDTDKVDIRNGLESGSLSY